MLALVILTCTYSTCKFIQDTTVKEFDLPITSFPTLYIVHRILNLIKTQDVVFTLLKREKEMNVRERERERNEWRRNGFCNREIER